jgi:peptidyl-Lys metalloendopeptidase
MPGTGRLLALYLFKFLPETHPELSNLLGDPMDRQLLQIKLLALSAWACSAAEPPPQSGTTLMGATEQPLITDSTCTGAQDLKIQYSDRIALPAAEAATRSIANNPLYTRCFGTYSATRAGDVQDVFDAVLNNWDSHTGDCNAPQPPPLLLDLCASTSPPAAWIYANQTGPIHICSPGLLGREALSLNGGGLANVLIHERTHAVSAVADESNAVCTAPTNLTCYGTSDALKLAVASPTQAVNNADNYESFAVAAHAARVVAPAQAILWSL